MGRRRKNGNKKKHPRQPSQQSSNGGTDGGENKESKNKKTIASTSNSHSQASKPEIKTEASLKETIKKKYCQTLDVKEGLFIGNLKMKVEHTDAKNKVQKLSIGKPNNLPTKVILLVGASGTGKTTLINAMANYILAVDFDDDFRFTIIDQKEDNFRSESKSQTDFITAFTFYNLPGMPFDFNYVLIDTPGFGDTRGIVRDKQMMVQIESFLKQDYGVDQVDGIGFVIPASTSRLTQTQIYVLDGLASMFGKDVQSNIFIMATFADARKPTVIKALADSSLKYTELYKFNNSALFARNMADDQGSTDSSASDNEEAVDMSKHYWDMAVRSMSNFFKKLSHMSPVSLTLTIEVLEERRNLQAVLISLQIQVRIGLDKLSILNQERQFLARLDDDIQGSRNYTIIVQVPEINEVRLRPDQCVTNCLKCSSTCHFPCHLPHTLNKQNCAVMKNGNCCACVGSCGWEVHKHMDFRYETKYKTEQRTAMALLARYRQALSGKQTKEEVIHKLEEEIDNHAKTLIKMIKDIQKHVDRLEDIALKPNPLSTKEYIDLMVESEKMQKQPYFERRIKMLLKLKEEVHILEAASEVVDNLPQTGEALLAHFQDLMVSGMNEDTDW